MSINVICCFCCWCFMCLFPYKNLNTSSKAYKYGITKYKCGGCPECLQEKSRQWALRCSAEAKNNIGMMLTLTYDTYIYDNNGSIIGENLPSKDIKVNKRDVQNFVKRLRSHFPNNDIKYLITAEYGKRTHRPHYHALIFGLKFNDLVKYKRSKRGNVIYRSRTLEKIWQGGRLKKGGICTVDCVNISAKTARYCTKYCAKDSGVDDTFMLFSHGIGYNQLVNEFNGKSYWIDGREYPVPNFVWKNYIESKYNILGYSKYVNFPKQEAIDKSCSSYFRQVNYDIKMANLFVEKNNLVSSIKRYFRAQNRRDIYASYRDNDIVYKSYINYWKNKTKIIEKYKPSIITRILALDDNKYRSYKNKAVVTYMKIKANMAYIPPRSNSRADYRRILKEKGLTTKSGRLIGEVNHLPSKTRHNTANDRKYRIINGKEVFLTPLPPGNCLKSPF